MLRQLGLAARFVSGYLIQLTPDQKSLDGPSGTEVDFTDLHAWCEVYLPGAGWIGLRPDVGPARRRRPHSGRVHAGTGQRGADIRRGRRKRSRVRAHHASPARARNAARDEAVHGRGVAAVQEMGAQVDEQLADMDVRLTMGGEPTFVAVERSRRGRMEHGRARADQARLRGLTDGQAARALRRGRLPASRSGQVVSGRAIAALGDVAVLARRRPADLGRPDAFRR